MIKHITKTDIRNQLLDNLELREYIIQKIDKNIQDKNYEPFCNSFLGIFKNYGFALNIPVDCTTIYDCGESPLIKHNTSGQVITLEELHKFVSEYYREYYEVGHPFYTSFSINTKQNFLEATFYCKKT